MFFHVFEYTFKIIFGEICLAFNWPIGLETQKFIIVIVTLIALRKETKIEAEDLWLNVNY